MFEATMGKIGCFNVPRGVFQRTPGLGKLKHSAPPYVLPHSIQGVAFTKTLCFAFSTLILSQSAAAVLDDYFQPCKSYSHHKKKCFN